MSSFGIPHQRPNGKDAFSVQDEVPASKGHYYAGENLAGAPFGYLGDNYGNEEATAKQIFQQWKDSPPHYANMMSQHARNVGVGVHHTTNSTRDIGAGIYGAMLIEGSY